MPEYIERGAVLQCLQLDCIGEMQEDDFTNKILATALRKIYRIPSADVAPVRHGRWILEPTNPYDDPGYKNRMIKRCSVCHWENACRYHYCPNCGAKMDEIERRK